MPSVVYQKHFRGDEERKIYSKVRDVLKENGKLKRVLAQNSKIAQGQVNRNRVILGNQILRIQDLNAKLEKENFTSNNLKHELKRLKKTYFNRRDEVSDLRNRFEHQCSLVAQKDEELATIKASLKEMEIKFTENADLLSRIYKENKMLREASVAFKSGTPNCEQEIAKNEEGLRGEDC